MTRSVPRNDEPDPDNIPQPTQARADAIKERASGIAPTEAPTVVDTPAVTVNGAMSSTAQVGDTLACTMGNWTGEPVYAYQWKNGQTDLDTGASYIVAAGDAPGSITCVVTALNAAGATTAPPSNAVMVEAAAAQQQPQEEADHGTEHRTHHARRDR
jgi:hypothetical protein